MSHNNLVLSLVVPCYNEEENVELFFDEVNKTFDGKIKDYEFVFIDDGSKDKTYDSLKKIFEKHKQNNNIQIISFSRNFGKESAIYAGLMKSKGDKVCIIDADLQQKPEVVLEMLDVMENNPNTDCVAAYQEKRKEGRVISKLKSSFYKIINKMTEIDFVNGASDFRLMKRNMVDAVLKMTEYHRFSKGLFAWVGFNTEYIPYEVADRENGESKWNFKSLLKYAIEGIVAFSTTPLKVSTVSGSLFSAMAIFYMIFVIIKKLVSGNDVPGYTTIVVLVLFLGGVQLISIGLIGEYLSKMYIQVKNRPIYLIKEYLDT
ncbi:MAG: glycosyltransferase family 2 protein, partial [Eubacterium sp.]|nr:glycosyltransferase family 2 protein [Eubacterium sp.]